MGLEQFLMTGIHLLNREMIPHQEKMMWWWSSSMLSLSFRYLYDLQNIIYTLFQALSKIKWLKTFQISC